MMNMKTLAAALCCCILASCAGPKNGAYSFQILTTNDVHGTFFDSTYGRGNVKKSLMAVKRTVDSVRTAVGKENVILIDAGDILQGDNAAYYFNYYGQVMASHYNMRPLAPSVYSDRLAEAPRKKDYFLGE